MGFTRRGRVLLVGLVGLLFCLSPPLAEGIRLPMFVPFGPDQGDEALERGNDDSAVVNLQQMIPFLGDDRGQIIVDTDGVLELREDQNAATSAFIYAFSADVDTTGIGEVFYRETTEPDVLETTSQLVNFAFPNVAIVPINIASAFVATWFYVGYFDNHMDRTNTFQCVVATDGVFSFVILLYADDLIEWMTGDADGGVGGLGGDRADVGIIGDDPNNAYFLPASNTSAVLALDSTSNIGMGGVWMFRVNDIGVILPEVDECVAELDNCDPNADCIDLVEGFECECSIGFTGDGIRCSMLASGSFSASASGDMPTLGSCVDARFTNCCVSNCDIANDTDNSTCFCDQSCFFFGDCCFDILDVPCFPDIQVQFVSSTHTVDESEGTVSIPIFITGNFPMPPLPPLEAFILLYSKDQTAEAPFDYDGTVQIIEFSSSGMQFASIIIVNDTVVENTESFTVNITTTDDFITVGLASTEVFIIDDDSVSVAFQLQDYIVAEAQVTLEVCATLIPPASISQLERSVFVNLSTAEGSATSSAPADYVSVSEMLVFSTDPVVCVEIEIISDGLFEFSEDFFLSLSGNDPGVVIDTCCATVTILDTDVVHIGFVETAFNIEEGEIVTVCVELFNGTLERDLMATIEASPDTASANDFASGSYPIVITAANQPGPECVDITTVDDLIHEGSSERFLLLLTAPSPQVFVDPPSGFVLIDDNDVIDLAIVDDTYFVNEGIGFVEVCVALSGERERTVTVDLFTDVGGTATEFDDYEPFTEALAFPPGPAQTLCRSITIIDDTTVEDTESFFVGINCGPCDNINVLQSSATVNIIDDDFVVIQFVMGFGAIAEGVGPVNVCLELIGTIERLVEVAVSTLSSSAVSPNDFNAVVNAPVRFSPPALTPVCIDIGIVEDVVVENTESFVVQIVQFDSAVLIGNPSMTEISIFDNDVPVAELVQGSYNILENVSPLSVCLTLNGAILERPVVVTISTTPGTALAVSDYVELSNFQVFFPPTPPGLPSLQQCADITIVDDVTPEDTETFTVAIDNPQPDPLLGAVPGILSSATVTIFDNDVADCAISFVQPTYLADENVLNGEVSVCLRLDGITTSDVSVSFSTLNTPGSATPIDDYEPISTVVTFNPTAPANIAFVCPMVEIIDDVLTEVDEFFTVSIGDSECSIAQNTATVTILDDERDEPIIEFQLSEYFVDEEDLLVMVCVEVSPLPEPGQTAEATYTTVDGSALVGVDYVFTSGTVTFTSTSAPIFCFNIPITDDGIPEQIESFSVELTQTLSAGVVAASVPVTINDNDPESFINFQFDSYSVDEDDLVVEICAVVSPPPAAGQSVTASYETFNGDAFAGVDYEVTVGQLTFTSTTPLIMCFTVPIIDDAMSESTESFNVQLTQTLFAGVETQQALVVIMDDDQATSLISFELAAYIVNEGSLTVEVCAVASPPPPLGQIVTASYSTSDGTAVADEDYEVTVGQFTFTALTPQPQCITIPIVDDLIFEQTETFSVTLLQSVSAGVLSQTVAVTIFDDDEVTSLINFELAAYDVSELGPMVEICAVASPPPAVGQVVSASYSTSDGTAVVDEDYEAAAGQFTFTALTPQPQCINIPIIDDPIFEQTETFNVILLQTVSAGVISQTAVVTIFDDDGVTSLINFELAAYDVSELSPTVEICAVASPPPAVGQVVSASYSTSDGTAVAGEDYITTSGQFTFTALTPQPQCITIPIIDDFVFEQTETFSVTLQQSLSVGVISQTAIVTIFDDDEVESLILFQFPQYNVDEDDIQVQICAVVSPDPSIGQTVSANYQTSDGTALAGQDYVFASGMISFTSTTPEPQCFNVLIINDATFETTETFSVTLTQQLSETVVFDSAVVTIFDDDQPPADCEIEFLTSPYLADEDLPLAVCIRLNGPTNTDVTVMFEAFNAIGDTATASVDYQPTSVVLTFSPTDTFAFLCPSVQLTNDANPEMDETFTVRISNSVCAINQDTATVIIEDDDSDESLIAFQFPDYNVNENELSVLICAVVSPPPSAGQSVSASYSTSDGTAISGFDYSGTSGILTFTSTSSAVQCFSVNILNDLQQESTEIFSVTLIQTLSTGNIELSASVTIFDDDGQADIFINFESLFTFVEEDMILVEVCAVTSSTPPAGQTVSATFTTQDGTAIAGPDYTFNSGTILFTAFTLQRQCINIPITDNDIEEPDETFNLILTQTVSAGVIEQSVTITILDNDLATLAFEQPSGYFVLETQPFVEACLVVDLSTIDGAFIFSVSISTSDVDATAGLDYTATIDTLVFSNGGERQCIQVPIIPDFLDEPNEEFQITFSRVGTPTQGTFVGMTSVTIINDFINEPIVLINNTPDVELEIGGTTASVEVDFTVRNDVASATCELSDLIGPMDCITGFIIFSGLPADRQEPLTLIITARNSLGEVLANISRQVRLGFNFDCSVNFINAAQDTVAMFQGPMVRLEWEEIGPVEFTECRLDQGDTNGIFVPCEPPYFILNIAPGEYSLKVRPNGDACERRIRRTVFFTVT